MKLLIAPWGDPSGWKEVDYEFDGNSVKSRTSLKILQEVINPDKTIIIGLDTLAEKGENYQEVKKNAEEKVREYAEKFGLRNYDVFISPGIGTFPNGTFKGSALDYYYHTIANISLVLLNEELPEFEIHLDLTHGLNYSPILTYRAVKEIAEVFSVFGSVRFKVYNADPCTRAAEKLFMNIIEDTIPNPTPPNQKIDKGRPLEPINLSNEEKEELFKSRLKRVREINKEEISAFIGALYNGLPLALFRFYPDADKLKEIIYESLNVYEEYVEVKNQGKLEVMRRVKFGEDFKAYIFAYVISVLLRNHKLVSSQKSEVPLDEIEKLRDNLFKFDERLEARIHNDVYSLRKDVEGEEIRNWRTYSEILGEKVGDPHQRNFLAHSGLERNVVEIKKDDGILVRYCEDKTKTIMKYCRKGLK